MAHFVANRCHTRIGNSLTVTDFGGGAVFAGFHKAPRFRCRSRNSLWPSKLSADFSSADICSAKPPAVPEAVKRHRKPPEGRVLQGFHEPPPKSVTVSEIRTPAGFQLVGDKWKGGRSPV